MRVLWHAAGPAVDVDCRGGSGDEAETRRTRPAAAEGDATGSSATQETAALKFDVAFNDSVDVHRLAERGHGLSRSLCRLSWRDGGRQRRGGRVLAAQAA